VIMPRIVRLHLCAILSAAGLAYLATRGDLLGSGTVFLASLGLIEKCINVFLRGRLRTIRREGLRFNQALRSIAIELKRLGARTIGLAALSHPRRYRVLGRLGEIPVDLPSTVNEVFSRFQGISFASEDVLELGWRGHGFVNVGRAFDGSESVVRESDPQVFELDALSLPGRTPARTAPC
jgi:hypothetical protein